MPSAAGALGAVAPMIANAAAQAAMSGLCFI
jgi:hypothetical protein